MQLSHSFPGLALFILALTSVGMTTPLAASESSENEAVTVAAADESATYLVSHEQMMHWIANTDAELTFIGKPINPLAPRSAQDTTVTYCNTRSFDVCGGACTVYRGGATCLAAPGTNCLAATNNVAFCSSGGCTGACNQFSTCGTRLDNNFCFTPDTQSILVSGA